MTGLETVLDPHSVCPMSFSFHEYHSGLSSSLLSTSQVAFLCGLLCGCSVHRLLTLAQDGEQDEGLGRFFSASCLCDLCQFLGIQGPLLTFEVTGHTRGVHT